MVSLFSCLRTNQCQQVRYNVVDLKKSSFDLPPSFFCWGGVVFLPWYQANARDVCAGAFVGGGGGAAMMANEPSPL
jgi:hypothetical protein